MKSKKKVFVTVLCAAALVVASVLGTMAYLMSHDAVTNTFTVGKVQITLDEAKVDQYGTAVTPAERVDRNGYKLIPGHTYLKDPTVHVDKDSEDSWVFVKVEDGLSDIEAGTTIAAQIEANGWLPLADNTGVYYKEYKSADRTPNAEYTDLPVFGNFTVKGDAVVSDYSNAKINVTAYAIQKDGFNTAAAAWEAVSEAVNNK